MNNPISTSFLSVQLLALGAALPAAAVDAELRDEIRQLEARIAALEEAEHSSSIDGERDEAIRELIGDVLADADQRAVLRDHGLLAGHDGSFFIASADNVFRLAIGGQFHWRFVYNRQRNSPSDDHRSGFEHRRMQLKFQGHAIDPRLTYKIQGAFNRDGGVFMLLDGEIGWSIGDGWSVRIGQFRPGFLREDSTSSTRQLAVERSLVNSRFAQNRMQGIELRGRINERVRVSAMLSDGLRSRNTPWQQRTVEYAITGRAEWLIAGGWQQFRQFTSPPGEQLGLMLGAAVHWQRDAFGTADDGELEILRWTVDGQLSLGGASFFAAFIASHENAHREASRRRWGIVAQAAAYVAPKWELFVRYEHGDLDEPIAGVDDHLSVLTAGLNWYIDGHRLKWTTDVGVGLKPVDSRWSTTSAGWRADSPGRKGQLVVRSQFQFLF